MVTKSKIEFDFTLPDLTHIGDRIKGKSKEIKIEKLKKTIKQKAEDLRDVNVMIEGITEIIKRSGQEAITRKRIREELRVYMWRRDYPFLADNFYKALKRMVKQGKAEKIMAPGKAHNHHREHYRLKS